MNVLVNLLLWIHLLALAMGVGGGLGMSQVGPRLFVAAPDQRATWWPLATVFSRVAALGLVLLLITGPLLIWLKFGGFGGLNGWFKLKMALVAVVILTVGLSDWGLARLRRGDEGGARVAAVTGPVTMLTVVAIVLVAVLAFN
ncbi:MAG TPA: hypothetical protein VIE16_08215 [Phenylobacterium sp.]|jgi:uncharacterized membrane protein